MNDDIYDDRWPDRDRPIEDVADEQEAGERPVEEPTTGEPPVEEPPSDEPPFEEPPIEQPPIEEPLMGEQPIGEPLPWELPAEEPQPWEPAAERAEDERPYEEERESVETMEEAPELDAIASGLEAELTPEIVKTSHIGEDVVLLGGAGEDAGQQAIVSPDGSVLAATADGAEPPPALDMGPERRGNAWVWVGLVLGFLMMAGALGYAWWYLNERPIETPNVIGRLPAQAAQALNDAGLRVGRVTEEPTDTAPVGTVVGQSPEPAAERKPGDPVSLVIAGPPQTSKVPEVRGVSLSEASRVLSNARLSAQAIESYSPTTPVGFVNSQAPAPGVQIEPGSTVALLVSKGAQPSGFRVPKLIGLAEVDAAALLGTIEVRAEVYRSFDNSIPAGVVLAQVPLQDTQVPYDGVVQYLVCKGPGINNVTVPDVVGISSDKAVKRIKETDLKSQFSYQVSADVPKGQVISQMPAARSKASAGETVGLVVSSGSATTVAVPKLSGMTADEASKKLSALGFRTVRIEVRTMSQAAGKVYLQLPAPGTPWPARYPVAVLLAAP